MLDLAYPLRWLWLHRRRSGWLYRAYLRWVRTPSRQSLAAFYPALLAGRLDRAERVLVSVFQQRADHRTQREALVAKLLLRIAQGNRLLAARILRFMTLHYSPADRDGAVAPLRPMLAGFAIGSAAPSALHALAEYHGPAAWSAFEPWLAAIVAALPDEPPVPARPRRHPIGVRPIAALRPAPRARSGHPAAVVLLASGGLGNQLFQYAVALGCARRSGVEPLVELAAYESPEAKRSFYLSRLALPLRVANLHELARAARFWHQEVPSLPDRVVLEHRGDIMLSGYWENPRYFAGIEAELRSRFRPRDTADAAAAAAFVTRARQGSALVGVHVRRGDRVPEGDSFHREILLSPAYYRRAAAEMPRDACFAVFSDRPEDVEWCRAHLGLEDFGRVTYADGRDPIVDFFALSGCDHQIISASTFSWWAAWLNPNPSKIVVAPPLQQGYGPRSAENDLDTRLPAEWRVVPDDPPDRCGAA